MKQSNRTDRRTAAQGMGRGGRGFRGQIRSATEYMQAGLGAKVTGDGALVGAEVLPLPPFRAIMARHFLPNARSSAPMSWLTLMATSHCSDPGRGILTPMAARMPKAAPRPSAGEGRGAREACRL